MSTGLPQIWPVALLLGAGQCRAWGVSNCEVWQHQSPGYSNTQTVILSLVCFTAGLHEVGSGVGSRLGEEDGTIDGCCGEAFKKLFVEVLLD